jgi:hypothetical protein
MKTPDATVSQPKKPALLDDMQDGPPGQADFPVPLRDNVAAANTTAVLQADDSASVTLPPPSGFMQLSRVRHGSAMGWWDKDSVSRAWLPDNERKGLKPWMDCLDGLLCGGVSFF